jgi:membrane-associated phospholipid phosphatase
VAFSGAVTLGWLYEPDLWALRTGQEHASTSLDAASSVFSFVGGLEVAGVALLVLLAGLLLHGRRALAGRLLVAFVTTGLVELTMKLYLPQAPLPQGVARSTDYAPLVAANLPHPYPSGHMLRVVILLGALYLLSRSRFVHAGIVTALVGIAAGRIYLGVHWASDIVGGALLGAAAVLWAFSKEDRGWRSR